MFTKNILNKRHNVTEYVFNNINRVVVHMNNTALNRMSGAKYQELTSAIKANAYCDTVNSKGFNVKTICGTFNC